MSAVGARQHHQQGPLLSGSGSGAGVMKQESDRRDPLPACSGRGGSEPATGARR